MDVSKMKIFVKAAIQYGNLGYLDLGVQELLSFYKECLIMAHYFEDISTEEQLIFSLGLLNEEIGCFEEALIYYEEFLKSAEKLEHLKIKLEAFNRMGKTYMSLKKYKEAIKYSIKCLDISTESGNKEGERDATAILAFAYYNLDDYQKAVSYMEKSLDVAVEIGDKKGEADGYTKLILFHLKMGQHHETIKYSKKSLELAVEIGNETGKRNACLCLGEAYQKLGSFNEAIEYYGETLKMTQDKLIQGKIYQRLSACYQSLGKYDEMIEYCEKRLHIVQEIGDEVEIASSYTTVGDAYRTKFEFDVAISFYEKSLDIGKKIGDKNKQQRACFLLGDCYRELVIPDKAISYYEKSIKLSKEIGDKMNEGSVSSNLGLVYQTLGKLEQAICYYEKSLKISEEMDDKQGESEACVNLGVIYKMLGKYEEATKYHQKSLDTSIEIGNKHGEGVAYLNLGCVLWATGKHLEAHENFETALKLFKELDCKNRVGETYDILGCFYDGLGKSSEAIHYLEKSLNIAKETGNDKKANDAYISLATAYLKVGKFHEAHHCLTSLQSNTDLIVNDKITALSVFYDLGYICEQLKEIEEAIKNFEICLDIAKEIGKRESEGTTYSHLGHCYLLINKFDEAIHCYEESLEIAKELDDRRIEASAYTILGSVNHRLSISHEKKHDKGKCQDAKRQSIHFLKEALRCWDLVYDNLQDNDDFKISIVDTYIEIYNELATVLIETDQIGEALLASDRGRARALGDILTSKYGIKPKTDAPKTTQLGIADVNKLLTKDNFCIINFAFHEDLVVWVLTPQKPPILIKCEKVALNCETQEVLQSEKYESNETRLMYSRVITAAYYKMKASKPGKYENRSLEFLEKVESVNAEIEPLFVSSDERNRAPGEETQNDSKEDTNPLELEQLYTALVSPILNDINQEDIVIIPDGPLYRVPFAALRDPDTGLFLSETKRIRLAPSLTTLKTLQECPSKYHCNKGALVVGDPEVGEVMFQGEKTIFPRLRSANHEAVVVGANLNVKPLIGSQATKEMFKKKLRKGVAIIHVAAHGCSENGCIALAPPPQTEGKTIPKEEDYILTMQEVQELGVDSQLVFLSCCHSGRGEIKAEGVVGMSRAFLAAGARAVVASLWAIDDDATLNFIVSFYTYLKEGETTSKSLQLAMKETREDGYVKQRHWAPFFLIGDDVTISV